MRTMVCRAVLIQTTLLGATRGDAPSVGSWAAQHQETLSRISFPPISGRRHRVNAIMDSCEAGLVL